MARSGVSDPLQNYSFALRELASPPVGNNPLLSAPVLGEDGSTSLIGFQSISMPDVTLELKEVNEGNWPHIHKVPMTRMTTGDVTLTKALYPKNSDFNTWIFQSVWGRGSVRRSFVIVHLARYHGAQIGEDHFDSGRFIHIHNCLPVSWKPGSDLEANSSDVSLEELTIHVERISLERVSPSQDLGNIFDI